MGITCVCWGLTYNSFISGAKEIDIAATVEHLRDQRPSMVKTKVRDITFFCEIWMSGVGFYHCSVVALPYQLSIIICPNGLLIASSKASSFLFSWTLICNRPGVNRSLQIFCSPCSEICSCLIWCCTQGKKSPCPTTKKDNIQSFLLVTQNVLHKEKFTHPHPKTVIKMLANSRKRNTPVSSKPTQLDINS